MTSKKNTPKVGRYEDRGKPGFTKLGLPRKKLGRPRDVNKDLPLEKQREVYLALHKKGVPLTLEQTRICIWDPKTEAHPPSKMAIQKIEQRALAKLKAKLLELGIKNVDDVLGFKRDHISESLPEEM